MAVIHRAALYWFICMGCRTTIRAPRAQHPCRTCRKTNWRFWIR